MDEVGDTVLYNDEELTMVKSGTSRYYCGTCATSFENLQKLNEHLHGCNMVWGMEE